MQDFIGCVVVAKRKAYQFATPETCRIQNDHADSGDIRLQRRSFVRRQTFCGVEQAENLGVRKDVGQSSRHLRWKLCGVRDKSVRILTPTKQAEVIYRPQPRPPRVGLQKGHRLIPSCKRFGCQIGSIAGYEESVEISQDVCRIQRLPAQRSFQSKITIQPWRKGGRECDGFSHGCTFRQESVVGSERATSCRSAIWRRRYTPVLSTLR